MLISRITEALSSGAVTLTRRPRILTRALIASSVLLNLHLSTPAALCNIYPSRREISRGEKHMFERFTQGARRTIFFARYEASNFGSPFIETEHLLLGILREAQGFAKWFPGESDARRAIRAEIEKRLPRKEQIPTSVEIPLSEECVKVLKLAMETADRLGHRQIELEHMVIGILRMEKSAA